MTPIRLVLGAGLILALATPVAIAQTAAKSPPATATALPAVEPEAVQALTRMSAYLGTLVSYEITAETSLDLVLDDGQALKLDGVNRYLVRRPDAFVVEVATAYKVRRLVYDGKRLTVHAPELGYYATVEAPPTIRETLDAAHDQYGLDVPLNDLFRWADPTRSEADRLKEAMVVGPARIGGVECTQYAFREGDIDWQIWIENGERPVPRKVVIVDRKSEDHPQFEARLAWNMTPAVSNDSFTFRPTKDEKLIRLSSLNTK